MVGCGWAGRRHADAYAATGAELAWAVDPDPRRASALGAAAIAGQVGTVLADPTLDALSVCVPHAIHAEIVLAALDAGKHVLVEKPIATTLADADRMLAAANRAGRQLMVAENVYFDPLVERVRALLDGDAIGRPALVQRTRAAWLQHAFTTQRRWFLDERAAGGGIMLAGGIHDVELLRLLLGEVVSVYALRAPRRFAEMEGDDTSTALLRFASGAVGTLVESFVMKSLATDGDLEVHTLRVDGEHGSLDVADAEHIRVFDERQPGVERIERVPAVDTFVREIAHFLAVIRDDAAPRSDGRSQRRALQVVLAAYRSMATGEAVAVP